MLEILAVGLLLIISIFLAFINWRIYKVTLDMLGVTIDIYYKTINLLDYTKQTYEILGGGEGLTTFPKVAKMEPIKKRKEDADDK